MKYILKTYFKEIVMFVLLFVGFSVFAKETRTTIAVVDTGIRYVKELQPYLCSEGHIDLTYSGIVDRHGHGTNIAGLLASNIDPKTHCLIIIKYWNTQQAPMVDVFRYMEYLVNLKPNYINMSFGGPAFNNFEYKGLKMLTKRGTIVFAAAGNEGHYFTPYFCDYYPACYHIKGVKVVAATDLSSSNYGNGVDYYVHGKNQTGFGITMSGTSQATAVALGLYIKGVLK